MPHRVGSRHTGAWGFRVDRQEPPRSRNQVMQDGTLAVVSGTQRSLRLAGSIGLHAPMRSSTRRLGQLRLAVRPVCTAARSARGLDGFRTDRGPGQGRASRNVTGPCRSGSQHLRDESGSGAPVEQPTASCDTVVATQRLETCEKISLRGFACAFWLHEPPGGGQSAAGRSGQSAGLHPALAA